MEEATLTTPPFGTGVLHDVGSSASTCTVETAKPATVPGRSEQLPVQLHTRESHTNGPLLPISTAGVGNPYQNFSWTQLHDTLTEKEYQIESLSDSLHRLAVHESESRRKDEVIASLRMELAAYKKNSRSKDISYVSMEEHLASCESHLQEKTETLKLISKQLEDTEKQLHSARCRSSSLQKELSTKSATISSQSEEIKALQRQQTSATEHVMSLTQECRQKQSSIVSLQERLKNLRAANQELQKRLEASQAEGNKLVATEQKTKGELERMRSKAASSRQLQARQDFLEQELCRTKERENGLACELGTAKKELASLCQSVMDLATSNQTTSSPSAAISAVSSLAREHSQLREKLTTTSEQLEKVQQLYTSVCGAVESLLGCFNEMKDAVADGGSTAILTALQSFLTGLQQIECHESLKELLDTMSNSLGSVQLCVHDLVSKWERLTSQLASSYRELEETQAEEDPFGIVTAIVELLHSKSDLSKQLQQRLCQSELEHTAALSGAVAAMRTDEEQRLKTQVEKIRGEEEVRHQEQLLEARHQLELERQTAVRREKDIAEAALGELEQTKQLLKEIDAEREVLKSKVASLENELTTMEGNNSQALQVADAQRNTMREQHADEVAGYKAQSQQYALTIVALEEKLLALMDKCQQLVDENEAFKQSLQNTDINEDDKGPEQLEKLQQLVGVLKRQLALVSKDEDRKQARIQQLEESAESLKREMKDHEVELQGQYSTMLEDLRLTLAKQEETIRTQKEEIRQLKELLQEKVDQLAEKVGECKKVSVELTTAKKQQAQQASMSRETCHKDLQRVAQKCLGERHEEVLGTQKTAIAQLKQKVKDLELAKPPVASHQATLKELSRVRHELLRERATRTMTEDDQPNHKIEEQRDKVQLELKNDFADLLHCSEKSYSHLVDTLCASLPVDRPSEKELALTDDKSVRQHIVRDRHKFAGIVRKHLKGGTDSSNHSEAQCSATLTKEVDPSQTISELETLLSTTAEELEQQKRLNQALLKRKNFKELQSSEATRKPRHNCIAHS